MGMRREEKSELVSLTRRSALLLPLAAAGCSTLDRWFGDTKTPLPGKREAILPPRRGLTIDNPRTRPVALPHPAPNKEWLQAGDNAAHVPGHPEVAVQLSRVWKADIGEGSGYRRLITARPVVAAGRVFAMDSDAVVSAYDLRSGERLWRTETAAPDDDSTNVGGGVALADGVAYVSTGRASLLALDASSGKIRWRQPLGTPARAAPTIADNRLFVPTLDEQLTAFARADGARLWSYQGGAVDTGLLGLPSPACAEALVVAGFGSGDLACLRVEDGTVTWTDGLGAARGRTSLADLSAVRAMPAIAQGTAYAVSFGGLCVGIDLRTGRRLWTREIASQESPWLAGDWLFILSLDQHVAAVNRLDGAVAWVAELPQFEDPKARTGPIHWVGPVLAGDRLIVAGSTEEALAISPYTGAILGRQPLTAAAAISPIVADGTVLFVTNDGSLLAFR
jgi:outer membrane protein assembly factor BamB